MVIDRHTDTDSPVNSIGAIINQNYQSNTDINEEFKFYIFAEKTLITGMSNFYIHCILK